MKNFILGTFLSAIICIIVFSNPQLENKSKQIQLCNHEQLDSLFATTYFVSKKDFKLMQVVRMDTTKCDTIKIKF